MKAWPFILVLASSALLAAPSRAQELPWREASRRVEARRDTIARRLEVVVPRLRAACADRPDLLARLDEEPPKPLAVGWGLLPPIAPDAPLPPSPRRPEEARFSLAELEEWAGRELGRLAGIDAAIDAPDGDLANAVEEERLARENLRRIESQIAYHAFWQPEAAKHRAFFAGFNATLARWRALVGMEGPEAEDARRRLADGVVTFARTESLSIEEWPDGERILRVPIETDIDDPFFLAAFVDGVETTWNAATAMRAARLRIVIDWIHASVSTLYPEGAPARGATIDLDCHRGRFGAPLVLTTGAGSTHAFAGAIVVGPSAIPRHDLAHELGHLLGFSDGYLRAHEGAPEDAGGVVFIELRELGGDLMSNPGTGIVSDDMVQRLIGAYAP